MESLTPEGAVLRSAGLITGIDRTDDWYRLQLVFDLRRVAGKRRVGGGFPLTNKRLDVFAHALLGWLPGPGARMMWVSHAENNFPGFLGLFEAARRGWGATADIAAAPGTLFEPAPYAEADPANLSHAERGLIGAACGLLS